jgi:phenylalanyl-tRNA synthetase alpha chain
MEQSLLAVKKEFEALELGALPAEKLEELRVRFLGRSGSVTGLLKQLKDLSMEERKALGPKAQQLKADIEAALNAVIEAKDREAKSAAASASTLDVTRPGEKPVRGRLHPLTQTMQEMARIMSLMGYSWAEGPNAELDEYNFAKLNFPPDHPARDSQDTFYLRGLPLLLRTHTSPVQIRTMESQRPPLRIICPGRVFRHEEVDASHSATFHQVEGLCVDKNISFADLKGTLSTFLQRLLGPGTETRFRPSFFPFVEPGTEVDVRCFLCGGEKGCPACKHTGWIEILGAGMVHPNVFKAVGYDPELWSGFAFGIGVERVAMLRHGVSDLRLFYENDLRFLGQFDENLL